MLWMHLSSTLVIYKYRLKEDHARNKIQCNYIRFEEYTARNLLYHNVYNIYLKLLKVFSDVILDIYEFNMKKFKIIQHLN